MTANDYLNDVAVFVTPTSRGQVWEFGVLADARTAIEALPALGAEASPYNWNPIEQPNGPGISYAARRPVNPRVLVTFR